MRGSLVTYFKKIYDFDIQWFRDWSVEILEKET